jgi:hypothetical protein
VLTFSSSPASARRARWFQYQDNQALGTRIIRGANSSHDKHD